MFCQKCGTQNPENGKFCRACGTNLVNSQFPGENFIQPMQPIQPAFYGGDNEYIKSNDPDELWSSGIQSVIVGVGFLIMAMVLLNTGVAGGRYWWWTMLFPAFPALGRGISKIAKSRRISKRNLGKNFGVQNQIPHFQASQNLPPAQENLLYIEQMIKDGRKIEAVRVYRETFGGDLKEATKAIEKIAAGKTTLNFQTPGEFIKPQKSIYDTGEFAAPPSVVEGTTRHLEIKDEDGTINLPKNQT
jgi:hypothetical protein